MASACKISHEDRRPVAEKCEAFHQVLRCVVETVGDGFKISEHRIGPAHAAQGRDAAGGEGRRHPRGLFPEGPFNQWKQQRRPWKRVRCDQSEPAALASLAHHLKHVFSRKRSSMFIRQPTIRPLAHLQ